MKGHTTLKEILGDAVDLVVTAAQSSPREFSDHRPRGRRGPRGQILALKETRETRVCAERSPFAQSVPRQFSDAPVKARQKPRIQPRDARAALNVSLGRIA